jgi:hypothetical protein
VRKFVVSIFCFSVQVWGTPWPLHTSVSSSHGIVSLATLGIICHLSLGVWKNTLSICLFYFVYLFCFVVIYFFCFFFFFVFRVFEENQVFLASFKLKRQIGKKLEAIGLITAHSRLECTCA